MRALYIYAPLSPFPSLPFIFFGFGFRDLEGVSFLSLQVLLSGYFLLHALFFCKTPMCPQVAADGVLYQSWLILLLSTIAAVMAR
jgi:hypothetical protein